MRYETSHILQKETLRPLRLNDSRDIMKQSAAGIIKALLLASLTERLTRETGTYDITPINVLIDMLYPLFLGKRNGG